MISHEMKSSAPESSPPGYDFIEMISCHLQSFSMGDDSVERKSSYWNHLRSKMIVKNMKSSFCMILGYEYDSGISI